MNINSFTFDPYEKQASFSDFLVISFSIFTLHCVQFPQLFLLAAKIFFQLK